MVFARIRPGYWFLALASAVSPAFAQTTPTPTASDTRAEAYFNFSMGHLYAELAGQYGNRGDYLTKAIDHSVHLVEISKRPH